MAVQAQYYPSNANALLLNRSSSNGQDTMFTAINNNNNSSSNHSHSHLLLQPSSQPGVTTATAAAAAAGFHHLDQSHHLLLPPNPDANPTNPNPRKRGRYAMVATSATAAPTTTTTSTAANNHQHAHIINSFTNSSRLIQHHQSPNALVSTGLKLAFAADHNQIHHHHQQSDTTFLHQFNQQSADLSQLINTHVDQLIHAVTEKRQRHYRLLLTSAEDALTRNLTDKQSHIDKATSRQLDLEARLAQLTAEAHLWQAKARAQEAEVVALKAQLQQAMLAGGAAGASSKLTTTIEGGDAAAEDAESAYIDPDRVITAATPTPTTTTSVPACRACGVRPATVVILPCRHLCVCPHCDALLNACPLCLSLTNSSVEVFLT